MIDFIKEVAAFMFHRKKFWLMPVLVMVSMLGLLLAFTQGSALAPFIYSIF